MLYFKSIQGLGIFFRIGGSQSEQVSLNGIPEKAIPEEAIAYKHKEVGINNFVQLRWAIVQPGHNTRGRINYTNDTRGRVNDTRGRVNET